MKTIQVLNIEQFGVEESSFYCNSFTEHLRVYHNSISKPHKHDFFLTVFFHKGSGIHEIDFNTYRIEPGTVFFLNPGQTHHWEPSEDAEGFILFHSREFFELNFLKRTLYEFPFFYSVLNPPFLKVSGRIARNVYSHFQEVYREYTSDEFLKGRKILALLDNLYIDLSRNYLSAENSNVLRSDAYSVKLRLLEKLIEQHYRKERSPAAYADMMHVSSRHLNRLVRDTLNKTTTELITERVILEAKRMLVYSTDSMDRMSYSLGFEDYAYFSRLFKKHVGVTPSAFAKKYK